MPRSILRKDTAADSSVGISASTGWKASSNRSRMSGSRSFPSSPSSRLRICSRKDLASALRDSGGLAAGSWFTPASSPAGRLSSSSSSEDSAARSSSSSSSPSSTDATSSGSSSLSSSSLSSPSSLMPTTASRSRVGAYALVCGVGGAVSAGGGAGGLKPSVMNVYPLGGCDRGCAAGAVPAGVGGAGGGAGGAAAVGLKPSLINVYPLGGDAVGAVGAVAAGVGMCGAGGAAAVGLKPSLINVYPLGGDAGGGAVAV